MDRVLVCDDDKEIVDAIEIYLRREDIDVVKAYNGKQALDLLEKEEVQLVLLDIMMPEMDGIEVLHEIKARSLVSEETAIIALTANAISGVREMYLSEGFDDYLSKPIEPAELESILRKYLVK